MRFLLAIPLLLALVGAGCSTPQQKAQKQAQRLEAKAKLENSRLVEEQRMRSIDGRDITSKRGAEIAVWDPDKTFDPSRSSVGGRTYDTGTARTKEFYAGDRKAATGSYRTRDFNGTKTAWAGDMKFSTKEATTGTYATRDARVKTAATKPAWDAGKTASVQDLPDGKREYLGPESKKLRKAVDPATMADWRNGGEAVVNTGSTMEKYSTMKQLTIDDIRELLNKNK